MSKLDDFTKKGIDPSIAQIILLDEIAGRLEEQNEKLDKITAFNQFKGPMIRMFRRDQQYQFATIPAGSSRRIYYLQNPQPDLLVGIIKQVANDWYAHTYLEWFTDYAPKRIEYIIGQIDHPKEFEEGIPFRHEVEWIAYNNDTLPHTFGVLCDGYFIARSTYEKIIEEEIIPLKNIVALR